MNRKFDLMASLSNFFVIKITDLDTETSVSVILVHAGSARPHLVEVSTKVDTLSSCTRNCTRPR